MYFEIEIGFFSEESVFFPMNFSSFSIVLYIVTNGYIADFTGYNGFQSDK